MGHNKCAVITERTVLTSFILPWVLKPATLFQWLIIIFEMPYNLWKLYLLDVLIYQRFFN